MNRIFLCGNGVNIQFNKKYNLNEFIDLLLHDEMLKIFVQNSTRIFSNSNSYNYYSKKENDLNEFLGIIRKFKSEILEAKDKLAKGGVEAVINDLFKSIENLLFFEEKDEEIYNNFEKYFKKLFFSYIWKLGNENSIFYCYGNSNFKKQLSAYLTIITLNYDNNLEKILSNKETKIKHWHGKIVEKLDGNLDFSNCLLDTIRNPKNSKSFMQWSGFKNYQKYKSKFELDIFGLNPLNDENVFALFINSQICNQINFYYHNENDLNNLDIVLKKIKSLWLETDVKTNEIFLKEAKNDRFSFKKEDSMTYKIWFNEKEELKINLIHSSNFWSDPFKINNYQ